jgi:uncharacterized protein
MNFETWFSALHPQIPLKSALAVLGLVADGGTVPFIARYRKEQTGNLDEVAIQSSIDAKEKWDSILKRQEFILGEIEHQQKLTPELKERIQATFDLTELDDLYLPYKKKRKTKATIAREAGLEPLADWIWNVGHGTETPQPGQTLEIWAFTFRNEAAGILDAAKAIEGAQDILVERMAEKQELRQLVRSRLFEQGSLSARKGAKPKANSKYENYFEYSEKVASLLKPENSHRYLAIRRGWIEEELGISFGASEASATKPASLAESSGARGAASDDPLHAELQSAFEAEACTVSDSDVSPALLKAARLAYKAYVLPSIESELHKALKDVADVVAIQVFAENVRKLLLASPFGPKAVLGVDPGVRTGCKLALVDDSGKYVASTVLHLKSDDEKAKAKVLLPEIVKNGNVRAVAVGNGTAGRETESFIRGAFKELSIDVPVVMVSEAGASVYSASDVAREEFPELDVTVRGAISIARRLQDPLAELVKTDPKSIGVGQYQHDVSQPQLKRSLDQVVDLCVNGVGVNLNTASYHLLAHVAGIGEGLAKAIVEHRSAKGLFKSREELLEVPRFSTKAFEQAAGFLRIAEGENPLDNTGVHPERYPILQDLAARLSKSVRDLLGEGARLVREARELKDQIGQFTWDDIVRELEKPGRDPREEFVPFQFRDDIHELKDLKKDMICPGIVTNVTNFGAFVDIGVHQDGLVHVSQLSHKFVKDPREAVSPGDRVQVKVLEVNLEKTQISLSIKAATEAPRQERAGRRARAERGEGKGEKRPPRGKRAEKPAPPRPTVSGNPSPIQPASARPARPMPQPRTHGKPAVMPKQPKQAFNNAFAGLASLRETLKKG